jgi:hypothetical protein
VNSGRDPGVPRPRRDDTCSVTTTTRQYRDTHIDVKFLLSALWTVTLFVFAYVIS